MQQHLQKKKEGFVHHEGTGSELHFPEVSEFEKTEILPQ